MQKTQFDSCLVVHIPYTQKPKVINTLQGHQDSVWCAAISRNGQIIASGSFDKTIKLWRAATGALICTLHSHQGAVICLDLNQDGNLMASGGGALNNAGHERHTQQAEDNTIQLWRLLGGHDATICHNLAGHAGMVLCVKFWSDGHTLVSASHDGHVILWSVSSGAQILRLNAHDGGARCVVWSRNSKLLATGGCDRIMRVWDVETGTLRQHHQVMMVVSTLFCSVTRWIS